MKIFKRIYYPVLLALALVFAFVSLFSAGRGASSVTLTDGKAKAIDKYVSGIAACETDNEIGEYIRTQLRNDAEVGVSVISTRPDKTEKLEDGTPNPDYGKNVSATYSVKNGAIAPTIVRQYATILPETSEKIAGEGTTYVNYEVINYIVAVPGRATIAKTAEPENEALSYGDAVAVIVNYDRSTLSKSGNAAAIASVMSAIDTLVSRETPVENDFVFVFAAGGENGSLGAYAFENQFRGYNRINERIKAVVSFSAGGADRAPVLSTGNGDGVKAFVKTAEDGYASSVMNLFDGGDSAVMAFDGVSAYTVTGFNNNTLGTVYDTVENLDSDFVSAMALTAENTVNYFAGLDLSKMDAEGAAYGYYDYLGASVAYSAVWSYVLGGLIILMLGAIGYFAVTKKNALDLKALGKGAAVQALTLVSTLAAVVALAFAVLLVLVGFGVINIHAIGSVTFGNAWVVAITAAVMLLISAPFYALYRKKLGVRLPYVAYGSAVLLAVASAITCFVCPTVALPSAAAGLTMLAILLATMLLKDKAKEIIGCNMSELMLFAIPSVFVLPVALSDAFAASTVAPVILLPLLLSLILGYAGTAVPFVGFFVEEKAAVCCSKKAEDGSVVRKERPLRGFGVPAAALIAAVGVALIAAIGALGFGRGASSSYSYEDEIYKDAIVYRVDNGVVTAEIRDKDLYGYVRKYEDGFKWSGEKGAYVLSDAPSIEVAQALTVSADNANSKRYIVYTSEKSAFDYKIKLSGFGAGNVTKVTFTEVNNGASVSYEVPSTLDELNYVVPAAYEGGFTVELEGDYTTVNIDVEQRCGSVSNLNKNSLWTLVHHGYSDDAFIAANLRMTLIMRSALTFNV